MADKRSATTNGRSDFENDTWHKAPESESGKGDAVVGSLMRGFLANKLATIEEERKQKLKSLKERAIREEGEVTVKIEPPDDFPSKHKHKKHKKDKKNKKDKKKHKHKEHERSASASPSRENVSRSRSRSKSRDRKRHHSNSSNSDSDGSAGKKARKTNKSKLDEMEARMRTKLESKLKEKQRKTYAQPPRIEADCLITKVDKDKGSDKRDKPKNGQRDSIMIDDDCDNTNNNRREAAGSASRLPNIEVTPVARLDLENLPTLYTGGGAGPPPPPTRAPAAELPPPPPADTSKPGMLGNLSQIRLQGGAAVSKPKEGREVRSKKKLDIKSVFCAEDEEQPKLKLQKLDEDVDVDNKDSAELRLAINSIHGPQPAAKKSENSDSVKADGVKKAVGGFGIKISTKSKEIIEQGLKLDKHGRPIEDGQLSSGSDTDADSDDTARKKKKKKHKKHKHKDDKEKIKVKEEKDDWTLDIKPDRRKLDRKMERDRRDRSRSKDRSRSRDRKRSRSRSRDRNNRSSRRSRSRDRSDRRRSPDRGRDRRRRSRSKSPLRDTAWRDRLTRPGIRGGGDRSRSPEGVESRRKREAADLRLKIDKAKLRKIAMANALASMQGGTGAVSTLPPETITALKAGGQSVNELTEFCKKISDKDKERRAARGESSDSEASWSPGSEDEADKPFGGVHHPFQVVPKADIIMNIRNAQQLPTTMYADKVAAGLHLSFPVSSGSQHAEKDIGDWASVNKNDLPPAPGGLGSATQANTAHTSNSAVANMLDPKPPPMPLADDKVFPDPPPKPMNIGALVSERLAAMRKLQENPNDSEAIKKMYEAQKTMNQWAQGVPGQFTGKASTGVKTLSIQELSPMPHAQAWAKKEQLKTCTAIKGGIGMALLQKMGWNQGEGLGKNRDGTALPLMLDIKNDRKGLLAADEAKKSMTPKTVPSGIKTNLSGKHPVSALVELCSKRRWKSPEFIVVNEAGPDHQRHFMFKVRVNNWEYQPTTASNNKKLAKAEAAAVCLQELGLLPRP